MWIKWHKVKQLWCEIKCTVWPCECVYVCVCVLKKVDITLLTGLFLGGTVTVVINLLSYTHIFFNK